MIFHEGKLSALLKREWKREGFSVGKHMGNYILAGGHWALQIDKEYLSNKIKGTVMELSGLLPDEGEMLKVQKDVEIQTEVLLGEAEEIRENAKKAEFSMWTPTPVRFGKTNGLYRIFKNEKKELLLVEEELTDLISMKWLKNESPAQGPQGKGGILFYSNERAALRIIAESYKADHPMTVFLQDMEKVRIPDKE